MMSNRTSWTAIFCLIALAAVLRFWGLTYQSLWLDECQVMVIADPEKSWAWLFSFLRCCEYHPPLFYILERLFFTILGYTDFTARLLPALAGIMSIGVMYLLGKEAFNKETGRIAALLASVNYYHIWYSQDARGYILAFLFAALSFLFFMRLIRQQDKRTAVKYVVSTVLLMYTHYYSLFLVLAQVVITALFYFIEGEGRQKFRRHFLISWLAIAVAYLPWTPFLLSMSGIDSIWMQAESADFVLRYFFEYFGNAPFLRPFLLLFLLIYCFQVLTHQKVDLKDIKKEPWLFSFVVFFLWIGITYLIPFLRTVLSVPMLLAKYTIVTLPAFLLILASAVNSIKNGIVKYLLLGVFVLLSLIDLAIIKKHYVNISKTQFREMTAYISGPGDRFPIINEKTAWQHQYYLKQFENDRQVWSGDKEKIIDSILNQNIEPDTFWLAGAHGDQPLGISKQEELLRQYYLVKQKKFYDAWAQLYARRDGVIILDPSHFSPEQILPIDGQDIITIWAGAIRSQPVTLSKGSYQVEVIARGSPLEDVYPILKLSFNDQEIGQFELSGAFEKWEASFQLEETSAVTFSLSLENDAYHAETAEDRNIFIRYLVVFQRPWL